ncbi:MAG: hypothetical protein HY451_02015 [Parcubacteria group bacterium]|nr:hypothetical protein [Parcubacteria group bacterium]
MTILRKKINLILLSFVVFLLSFYIYQTISISSGKISLIHYKKEFLERKNNLSASTASLKNRDNFDPDFIKENFKMAEIEKFDYIIVGPSEFALIENNSGEQKQ